MKCREKPHAEDQKIKIFWNYDAGCTLTTLPVPGVYVMQIILVTDKICLLHLASNIKISH